MLGVLHCCRLSVGKARHVSLIVGSTVVQTSVEGELGWKNPAKVWLLILNSDLNIYDSVTQTGIIQGFLYRKSLQPPVHTITFIYNRLVQLLYA